MIDNFDHDKFTKLVEKKLTQEGVFDSIGKYFSDIFKAGKAAAADPERYWKEKQQRHWTHGDGTKRTEQPPEPPKEAEDELLTGDGKPVLDQSETNNINLDDSYDEDIEALMNRNYNYSDRKKIFAEALQNQNQIGF